MLISAQSPVYSGRYHSNAANTLKIGPRFGKTDSSANGRHNKPQSRAPLSMRALLLMMFSLPLVSTLAACSGINLSSSSSCSNPTPVVSTAVPGSASGDPTINGCIAPNFDQALEHISSYQSSDSHATSADINNEAIVLSVLMNHPTAQQLQAVQDKLGQDAFQQALEHTQTYQSSDSRSTSADVNDWAIILAVLLSNPTTAQKQAVQDALGTDAFQLALDHTQTFKSSDSQTTSADINDGAVILAVLLSDPTNAQKQAIQDALGADAFQIALAHTQNYESSDSQTTSSDINDGAIILAILLSNPTDAQKQAVQDALGTDAFQQAVDHINTFEFSDANATSADANDQAIILAVLLSNPTAAQQQALQQKLTPQAYQNLLALVQSTKTSGLQ